MDRDTAPSRRARGPRLYHKKSRTGCVRCKQRRVKCDEVRPTCGGCSRHVVDCVYSNHQTPNTSASPPTLVRAVSTSARSKTLDEPDRAVASPHSTENSHRGSFGPTPPAYGTPGSSTAQASPTSSPTDASDDLELLPETRERRMWDLRLFHNAVMMSQPFQPSEGQSPELKRLWQIDVPNMALVDGSDLVLYGMQAHSALNLILKNPPGKEREELEVLHRTYLSLQLRQQRRDVSQLSPANADPLCISSLRILTHALALVQTLPMDPWEPPVEWLQMGHGAGVVFRAAFDVMDEHSKFRIFLKAPGVSEDPNETIFSDHSALDWLLDSPSGPDPADTELSDEATRRVYHEALAYTCSTIRAIQRGEPSGAIGRRLGAFSVWVPIEFAQFLVEKRPRAMVILAHFMSLWLEYEDVWIMGKAGERQIRGIHKSLPLEWSSKLDGLFAKFKTTKTRA